MAQIKFVQTWDTVAGRKQEYAAFITMEFLPGLKAAGLDVDSGWYTLLGRGPHMVVDSLAGSLNEVEKAVHNKEAREMLDRFMNLVTGYSSCVLESAGWETRERGEASTRGAARFLQVWDILPGEREALERFVREEHLPEMARIGLEVTSAWRLALGAGPQIVLEATAADLSNIFNALGDERYLRLIMRIEEMVTRQENRVMVRIERFLDVLYNMYGRAIRAVLPDTMHSMVGPVGE
ncbi:MAG: hypothetical protein JW882_01040 [Deltaproteobacteria bacterium]|nr:hypothetical protein [Deltaproteobacteria bacterium]